MKNRQKFFKMLFESFIVYAVEFKCQQKIEIYEKSEKSENWVKKLGKSAKYYVYAYT